MSDQLAPTSAGAERVEPAPVVPDGHEPRPWPVWWFVAPLFVATLISLGRDWIPIGDLALVDLRLRQIWSHPPVVGAYSRFGWDHPGPFMYWFMWLPWKLAGEQARGLLFATLVWHCTAAGVSLRIAARVGGRSLQTITAIVLVAGGVAAATDAMIQPWNPYLNILLVPALVLSWSGALQGDRVSALWFLGVGSVMAQNHLGMVPPVGAMGAVVAIAFIARTVRAQRSDRTVHAVPDADAADPALGTDSGHGTDSVRGRPEGLTGRFVAAAVGLMGVLWALPIGQQLFGERGNIGLIVRFVQDSEDRLGTVGALNILGRMLGPTPPWLGIRPPIQEFLGGIEVTNWGWQVWPVLVVIPVLGWLAARRRADELPQRLLRDIAAVLVLGVVSIAGISGLPHEYLVFWVSITCGLWVVVGAWSIGRSTAYFATLPERCSPSMRHRAGPAILAVAGVALSALILSEPDPYEFAQPAASALSAGMLAELGAPSGALAFEEPTKYESQSYYSALMSIAEEAGWTTYAPTDDISGLGPQRNSPERPSGTRQLTAVTGSAASVYFDDSGYRLVTQYQPFSETGRVAIWELDRRTKEIRALPNPTEAESTELFYANEELKELQDGKVDVYLFLSVEPS